MGLQTTTVEIDGHEYEITQLGALEARIVQARLGSLLGPAADALAKAERLDETAIAVAFKAVVGSLTPEVFVDLTDRFMATTRVRTGVNDAGQPTWARLSDHSRQVFDQHFAGRMLAMDRWIWQCIRLNFADFLGEAGITSLLEAAAASRFGSPEKSTGSSGE